MKTYITLIIFLFLTSAVNAHPSWAFLMDKNERIYLVDLLNNDGTLIRLDLKKQEFKVLATGFHCHSMQLGKDGHIYAGLNIWRQGEIEGEGHNYVIRINTDTGSLDTLLFSDRYLNYFGGDIAMSKDLSRVYYHYENHLYTKTLPDKPTRKLIDHTFKRASTMAMDNKGDLWIADTRQDNGSLYRWNKREGLQAYVSGLIPAKPKDPVFKERRHHIFFGIAFNENGDPLVAESADRKVWEIPASGQKRMIYQSPKHWHPLMTLHHRSKYHVLETGWVPGKGFQDLKIQILNDKLEVEKTVVVHTQKRKLEVIPKY